jgi:hypothetical protein
LQVESPNVQGKLSRRQEEKNVNKQQTANEATDVENSAPSRVGLTDLLGDLADIFRLLDAVGTAANFFDNCRIECKAGDDTKRQQLVLTESALRQIIENSVCPIWGEVSDLVREKCRACGF